MIETGGRSIFESTRRFYERMGYGELARAKDFYAAGDDKVIYGKTMEPPKETPK